MTVGGRAGRAKAASEPGQLAVAWDIFGPTHVPYRILIVGKMLDRLTAQHVRDLADLTLAEWRVIAHLAALGEMSASEISSAALVDRSEVSRAVSVLLANKTLERRPNPRNRKSHLVALTPTGRELFDAVQKARLAFFAEVMSDLSAAQRALLDEMLLSIAVRADQLAGNGTRAIDGSGPDRR